MNIPRPLQRLLRHPRLPRRTVRIQLTLLYGGLFLLCGTGLLATTYVLLQHSSFGFVQNSQEGILMVREDGTAFMVRPDGVQPLAEDAETPEDANSVASPTPPPDLNPPPDGAPTPQQVQAAQFLLAEVANSQKSAFLTRSGAALALMSAVSLVLGWLVAGRILRPVRTITTSTRQISATNLHQRLTLQGPDDELKELGDTIDDLLTRLEASFQSQRRFVANASHELRTPLARQRTVVQVALADPDATVDSLRTAHERVLNATYQQERLIDALLTLARGERGLDRRQPVDLTDVATAVLLAREAEAGRRGLRLTTQLDEAHTLGDPHLIERLAVNLVDNALRYNVAPGRLEVSTATKVNTAVLTVTNTGPLVPADQVSRLFQPFQRLDTDRTHHDGGLGLGLSIVQAIATAHAATITAHPLPNGGMEITVTFPGAARGQSVSPATPGRISTPRLTT
ncbi:HAMP domain-containing histidine kinase [Micromonospora sp. KC606]|uniref:HAMP domain-containing sensor histidine kinase n=1 Tax=Micromonospora sp. KC606 TaxID=2530379 RepID=UPI001043431A|nr:HAMP domain-containing sensor histidine kinase [Micromonospora sp. KC606]TDC72774.1 HAMP domain-containing histidine kinase [Micromonospora sp. KC606]